MQLTRSSEYALRIPVMLAEQGDNAKTISASAFAAEFTLWIQYLVQIGSMLRNNGFVGVEIGPYGWCYLLREPKDISLCQIITLVKGPIVTSNCRTLPALCMTLIRFQKCQGHVWRHHADVCVPVLKKGCKPRMQYTGSMALRRVALQGAPFGCNNYQFGLFRIALVKMGERGWVKP